MIDAAEFARLAAAVKAAGYGDDIEWSENVEPPIDAEEFAREAIFVICNSGMRFTVARGIFDRVMAALQRGESASTAFGHVGKAGAIDLIWQDRAIFYANFLSTNDVLEFCESLPWIGPITKYHLAKNFGANVAKPDVHLARLAKREGVTPHQLCQRLAIATGYRIATVDVVLWRACAIGAIKSRELGDADE
jgi:hypothetical protein